MYDECLEEVSREIVKFDLASLVEELADKYNISWRVILDEMVYPEIECDVATKLFDND